MDEILFVVKGIEARIDEFSKKLDGLSIVSLKGETFHKKPEPVKKELENTVNESIKGTVSLVTEKAVKIIVGDKYAWIPKKCVANLDKIALEEGSTPEIDLVGWFQKKIEWKRID